MRVIIRCVGPLSWLLGRMEANQQNSKSNSAKRIVVWLGLICAGIASLWCCNLIIFHLWASDVPPYSTEWHLQSAKYSAIALVLFVIMFSVCVRYLLSGRIK